MRPLIKALMRGMLFGALFLIAFMQGFGQARSDRAINLEELNTPSSEVAPIITADGNTIYFTSDRAGGMGGQDFWTSRRVGGKWTAPINIGELNTSQNEGPDTITADGKTMYYTGCNRRPDGSDKCDIYVTHLSADRKWRPGENLGPPINTDYEEANATISSDGKLLIFTSNRPGGLGGYDLWMSALQPNGKWGEPKNLGANVNTPMWEGVAFIHSDGVTMYFSSNGRGGFGNADIFQTQLNPDRSWSEPVNMGGLVNSPYNDIYFTVPASGDLAYFSSSSEEGFGREDLYAIPKQMIFKSRDYIVVRGKVTNADTGAPVAAMLTTGGGTEKVPQTTSNPGTGNYTLRLKIGSTYAITASAQGFLDNTSALNLTVADPFHIVTHNIQHKPVGMVAEAAPPQVTEEALPEDAEEILIEGGRLVVRNVLFDFDKYDLKSTAIPILERLVEFMNKNSQVRIKVDGFADSIGSEDYNLRLSIKRAEAVKRYMVLRGVAAVRIVTEGHGEANLVAQDDPKTGNEKNRRVEFSLVRGTYAPTSNPNTSMRGKQPPENVPNNQMAAIGVTALPPTTVSPAPAPVIDIPSELTVKVALIATNVADRIPSGTGTVFPSSVGRLYFFTYIVGAQSEITVTHKWYYKGQLISRIPLKIKSPEFRTWSYVDISPSWQGALRAEIVGPDGKVLSTVRFTLAK